MFIWENDPHLNKDYFLSRKMFKKAEFQSF